MKCSERQQAESGMALLGGLAWNVLWSYAVLRVTLGTTFLFHGVNPEFPFCLSDFNSAYRSTGLPQQDFGPVWPSFGPRCRQPRREGSV
jgi:hypothetical protein